MHSTETLILSGEGYSLSLSTEATELKAQLIDAARTIQTVGSTEDAENARAALKPLAWLRTQLEKSRKAVKEPVIQVGKQIDDIARAFLADALVEEKRLEKAVADYAAQQEAIRRAAVEAARREQQEVARKAQELEELRKKQDFASQVAADEKRDELHAAHMTLAPMLAAVPDAVEGTKTVLDYEVVDPVLFGTYFPNLVTVTLNRADVLEFIRRTYASGNDGRIPGINVVEKIVVSKR